MIVVAAALQLLVAAVLCSGLEGAFRARAAQRPWWRRRSRSLALDIAGWLVHPVTTAAGLSAAVAVAAALGAVVPWPVAALQGVVRAAGWPMQGALAFVVGDLLGYAIHRAYHRVPWLWSFHALHHTSAEVDWLSTSRLHPVSQTANTALSAFALLMLGLPAPVILGASAVSGLLAVMAHANVRWGFGHVARVVVSPRFHHRHHDEDGAGWNFGAALSVWDHLFGTADRPAR